MTDASDPILQITRDNEAAGSGDLVAGNVARLKAIFPDIVTDGKIDLDTLRELLGDEIEDGQERYGLNWKGKRRARAFALTPSLGTLRPAPNDSVDWETTQNIVVQGDNLEALKLLRRSYANKVKLIYIDPPYNTAGDFIYPDNYRNPIAQYLALTGQTGGDGEALISDREERGRLHTDWLNMIYPRLMLAKEIMADDGIIAISINDIESPNLRLVCDELFGSENIISQFVWNNEGNVDQQSKIKGVHEYIVCYAKKIAMIARPNIIDPNVEETSKLFNDAIENTITKNGPANPASIVVLPIGFPATFSDGIIKPRKDMWPHIHETIRVKDGVVTAPATVESGWSSRNLLDLFIRNGFEDIVDAEGNARRFALTESGAIYTYKSRGAGQGHVLSVIRNVGTTKQNS
ncbi:site-specific DNA-methyltransferase [Sphingomonas sp. PAMC 26621]|uniref:site-specific DNA-methyltransferase n=1 Tax=Sphingomonas sp. PAMC 26621 TaxID=1112213 RepID=UPI0002ED154F|nr:site-specific DNA-methyltransferase [Sphingomonas sp. PAMC 26621]